MTTRFRLAFVLAAGTLAGVLDAQELPRVVTAEVRDASDGTSASGAPWRSWPVADPIGGMTTSPPSDAVGLVRPGALWAGTPRPAGESEVLLDRVVAVELGVPDAGAPAGLAGYVAVLRSARRARFSAFAPTQLVALPRPATAIDGAIVHVTIAPMQSVGVPLVDAQGLAAYALERSAAGMDVFTEIARAAAGVADVVIDDAPPAGRWEYAVRALFSGDVRGLHLSRRSDIVDTTSTVACVEPSDVGRPGATPLLLRRIDASTLRATWQDVGAPGYDVYRGSIAALSGGVYDHAVTGTCRVIAPSSDLPLGIGDAYFLAASHCGNVISSVGRASDGTERPAPVASCP